MAEHAVQSCEVCSKEIPAGQAPVLVGSCEFPFHVHEECKDALAPVAGFVEELCALSDEQPEGLMNMGSWSGDQGVPGVDYPSPGKEAAAAFLDAYFAGDEPPTGAPLNVENAALYLNGWWPVAVCLRHDAYVVRTEDDPEGLALRALVTERLAARGLHRCAVDDRLLESIALQRLGLLHAEWEAWAPDEETAVDAVGAAAAG